MRHLRILLPIMLVHLVVIPLSVNRFLAHFEEPVWQAEKRLAIAILHEAQDHFAVRHWSTNGLQTTVQELSREYEFGGLSVYNDRLELKSSAGQEFQKLPDTESKSSVAEISGDYMLATQWVTNEKTCHTCHNPGQPFVGVIQASIPISEIASTMASQRKHAMVVTFSALVGVFLLISLFHYYFIILPVKRIVREMGKVKGGDLSVRIPVQRDDELGMLASGFNEVVHSLQEARQELERRHHSDMVRAEQLATVGEIAAGLAHEVKNPIAGMTSALEVVVSEMPESSHKEILVQVIEETHRITSTINSLLDYARPRAPKPDWFDVEMMMSDIQTIFAPQCQQRRVSFLMNLDQNAGRICVDNQIFKQILMNILRNSLEAVSAEGKIVLTVRPTPDRIALIIEDDGPGMDEATRARIFQPFYTTKPGGTGLGLAIVHRLIQDMGGSVKVDSSPGNGARFEIEMPRECRCETADRG